MQLYYRLFLFIVLFTSTLWAQDKESMMWKPPTYGEQKAMGYEFSTFTVPPSLKDEVNFWIKIYTQYSTTQGLFHVAGDINSILGEIDLTDIYLNPKWGPIRREIEAKIVIERQRKFIARKHGIKDIKTVRLQMGLKDRMQKAIFESGKYLPMMEQIFEENNIPKELTRVVFVESSFNTEARSKVGASGLWQIMPNVGHKYKYIQKSYDKRDHPKYATKLAADIFKQNYKILNSWPLAVTSYNFGVGSMLKVRKKMGTTDANQIFSSNNVKKHIGFASRNFYATFLAALQVESHANLYFGEPFMVSKPLNMEYIYLAKDTKYDDLVSKYKLDYKEFKALNIHIESKFMKKGRTLPKGTLVSVPQAPIKTAIIEN
jgi:membrane-bound lytic murein transglycosylase D